MEYPSDRFAVLLVRVQQLSQSISMALSFRTKLDDVPLAMIVRSFEDQIEQLRASAAQDFHDHSKTPFYFY